MEPTFVVSGSHKSLKKPKKTFFLPEIFVENEETVRQRSSSLIKHSTPYQSSPNSPTSGVHSGEGKKGYINLDNSVDSGFDDWSINSSINSRCDSIRSDNTIFKTPYAPHAKPESFWESFATPIADLKQHFKGRQTFVDERVKLKLNFETLVTVCLGVVMFSSIVFSVYMGTHYTKFSTQNGKYKSIEYGTNKRIQTLKEQGRIIDYDLKDEFGNNLGGKRAAIQFAYEQKYGKEGPENVKPDIKPREVPAPIPKRVNNEVRPKVVEATVQEPVPNTQNAQDLSIAELSRKIDELDALLQDDLLASEVEVETATKVNNLKQRKKRLMEKVKTKPSTRPASRQTPKPVVEQTPEPVVESKPVPVKSRRAANAKAKTKVENPLTKSIPEVKQSKPKKINKKVVEAADAIAASDAGSDAASDAISEKNEYPGSEDSFDVDPGLVDYPDDPQFRGPEEL
jgi:hypothetical protein